MTPRSVKHRQPKTVGRRKASRSAGDTTNPASSIFPAVRHPYYVVAPPYTRSSAGIRALHLLCHALNRTGRPAWMMLTPHFPWRPTQTDPDLLTPGLTPELARNHFQRGLTPIVVYPEIVLGNPFNAPCTVRYILNFPGLLGGARSYGSDELCIGYSHALAKAVGHPDNVLFIPASDTRIFRPPDKPTTRRGSCFYAAKYQDLHRAPLLETTRGSVEITRDRPDSPTAEQVAALLQRSEVFYTYENSALATEAVLCGCPAVFLPNPYLSEIIAARELGPEGYAWGATPATIKWAKQTVRQGQQNYRAAFDQFWRDLETFVERTQAHAQDKVYRRPIRVPTYAGSAHEWLRSRGFKGAALAVARKAYRAWR